MDIEKFISDAKQDYEMQKCWNDTEPQTHWEWIENYFRELHKLSFPLERVVSRKVAKIIDEEITRLMFDTSNTELIKAAKINALDEFKKKIISSNFSE